ncbi:MAG: hypothetical protein ACX931_07745 [Saccharospirillum sp.]
MDVFTFVLAIVALSIIGGLVKEVIRARQKGNKQQVTDHQVRIETLEARVATLERILTDEKETLKREIDDLSRKSA